MDQLNTQTDYEFGGFRLDTVLQVLVSATGEPIALPARAFDALRFLVERAGELVDKRSLMRALWPNTVVEENNLNQCILTIRKALGEAAGERRFILTVPGRGFKFVAPVKAVYSPRVADVGEVKSPSRPRYLNLALAVLLAVSALTASALYYFRARPVTSPVEYEALTDVGDAATAPALSPDGHMLAFIGGGTAFLGTGQIYVKMLPDGQPVRLTHLAGPIYAPTFTPDGTRVAYTLVQKQQDLLTWDTWTVPVTGGEPTMLLSNAAGLGWIGPHQVLYSEIKTGLHMGLVTSGDDRAAQRDLYFPGHERGMAHYSYLSPDRRSVLLVEMDRTGEWQRCRLIPFAGNSAGTQVGPTGRCLSAAWAPDGNWMYFSAEVSGHWHLWRQRYPGNSDAEQITFGPTEEQGVATSPDGRSLVTSLGLLQQSIWIHDSNGERRVTNEKMASVPWLSTDAHRLYFLSAAGAADSSDLWRLDIERGQKDSLLPGFAVADYDISHDEREVTFAIKRDGEPQLWIAPIDRHTPPKLLVHGADEPRFDGAGHIYFRLLGEKANYLYRVRDDGSAKERVVDTPILDFLNVSPSGKWVAVHAVLDGNSATSIMGVGNETFRWSRNGWWPVRWSSDGRMLYLEAGPASNDSFTHGRTLPIALTDGAVPPIPDMPVADTAGLLPHATEGFFPGPNPETYVFTRTDRRQNIFRIPLH